jgi:kynurenine formamidase
LKAIVSLGGSDWETDLDHPVCLAIETRFAGEGPLCFGAPPAGARPLAVPGFTGSVAAGASCNCSTLTLTPHCNGTHTECVGHLTTQPLDAIRVVPAGLIPALVATVDPDPGGLITPRLLEAAWRHPPRWNTAPRALVMRTLPNDEAKRRRDYTGRATPHFTADAAQWLVDRGIEHLIVDLPSIDRMSDEGRLAAHRVFFGLPAAATDLALAARTDCTVTELAYVPDAVTDGAYLLQLQVPALAGDAVPSRPLLYAAERVHEADRARASGERLP